MKLDRGGGGGGEKTFRKLYNPSSAFTSRTLSGREMIVYGLVRYPLGYERACVHSASSFPSKNLHLISFFRVF